MKRGGDVWRVWVRIVESVSEEAEGEWREGGNEGLGMMRTERVRIGR